MATTVIFTWQGETDVTTMLLLLFGLTAISVGGLSMGRLALASRINVQCPRIKKRIR